MIIAWLDAGGLSPSDGPDRTADLLVACVHHSVDWDVWGGSRAVRYWDALTERVRASTYAGPGLADWWGAMTRSLSLHPLGRDADRVVLAALLASGSDREVLDVLRRRADVVVLRVRVAVDAAKQARAENKEDS